MRSSRGGRRSKLGLWSAKQFAARYEFVPLDELQRLPGLYLDIACRMLLADSGRNGV